MKENYSIGIAQRGFAALVVAGLLVIGFAVAPASADRPAEFTDSVTFTDVNPCSGELHDITLFLEIRVHEHRNNVVVHVSRTGTTSDGYVMNHGVESYQENANIARGAFTDQWRASDGSKFRARGNFAFDISAGEPIVDRFSLTCIGN